MLWNTHTGRTPQPSPRTAQYAHTQGAYLQTSSVSSFRKAHSPVPPAGSSPLASHLHPYTLSNSSLASARRPIPTLSPTSLRSSREGALLHHHTRLCYPA